MAQLTEEAQTEISQLPELALIDAKAKVTVQLDEILSRAYSVNDYATHIRSTILDVPQPFRALSLAKGDEPALPQDNPSPLPIGRGSLEGWFSGG